MKKVASKGDLIVTAVLVGTALALTVILMFTQAALDSQYKRFESPPKVLLEFWDQYIPLRSEVDQEVLLERYFSCIDSGEKLEDGRSMDLLNINAVLLTTDSDITSYRVCSARKNYIELMLQDSEGNDLPCRIGMFYILGAENRISSYSIFRLLPVSKSDVEWNGAWL